MQPQGGAPAPAAPDAPAAGEPRACANCGAPLAAGQDWCLKCGSAAPGSLAAPSPGWRSGAAVLGAVALLIAGAGAAAYAAFGKSEQAPRPAPAALARVPATSAPGAVVTPPPAAPGAITPTPKVGAPTTIRPTLPLSRAPRIAVPPLTPKPASTPTPAATPTRTTTTTPSKSGTGGSSSQPAEGEPKSKAILLDTNAASTYNPTALPASSFGDPSLAIDGDSTTGWTALVERATAPKMAVGLTIDLKTPLRLGALALVTSTPGSTVQLYGTAASSLPAAITDPSWVRLSPAFVEKKRRMRLTLGQPKRALHFVALWISKAPAASAGRVSINEIELFPPGK